MSMGTKICLFIFFLQYNFIAHGQSFFNINPELESIGGQGRCSVIFPIDSSFLVFGHRYDTSFGGSSSKPWYAKINYDGMMERQFSLRDVAYEDTFNALRLSFAKKDDSIWYGYSGRFINSNSTPYIYKLNIQTGEIISSQVIPNLHFPTDKMAPDKIFYINDTISLLSYHQDSDSTRLYITELDTLFNVIREFRVKSTSEKQFPKYFSRNPDGTYLLVLDSKLSQIDNYSTYNTSYMSLDKNGILVSFKWSPTTFPLSNGLVQAKNVIQDDQGNWIILASNYIKSPDSCYLCSIEHPYIFSVSSNFETLLWETRFIDIPPRIGPYYDIFSITQVEDGYIGSGEFRQLDLIGPTSSGILFKTNHDGDSLWMKHYIPLGWENEQVGFLGFLDVKTTPDGTIIAAGDAYDNFRQALLPWILHLDKDGCLVPGCNLINVLGQDLQTNVNEDRFSIFPNPAVEDIYLLSKMSSNENFLIQLVSNAGSIIKKALFVPEKGFQYTLPLDNIFPGMYHLIFTDPQTMQSESHTFIKQ